VDETEDEVDKLLVSEVDVAVFSVSPGGGTVVEVKPAVAEVRVVWVDAPGVMVVEAGSAPGPIRGPVGISPSGERFLIIRLIFSWRRFTSTEAWVIMMIWESVRKMRVRLVRLNLEENMITTGCLAWISECQTNK
jgi:hypothetical protein